MPWNDTSLMDQRTQFIADWLRRREAFSELCDRYRISRKTGYKLVDRYQADGPEGLRERSSRPHSSPLQTSAEVVAAILEVRNRHPRWGAKKLLRILGQREPDRAWPARSTVCDILSRAGLVPRPPRRRRLGHPGRPTTPMTEPNDVWCADYKGHFRTGDGIYCYPLTVTDGCSRYLLACQSRPSTETRLAKPVFERLFREFGLPERIRSDNGVPFASASLARLSRLSAWWVRLGILPELIEPGCPQQNGRHERMHRTLKDHTARPPAANASAQQRRFNRFQNEFNNERPHEALEMETPASVYRPSHRPMPARIPALEYPSHFETRYVSANGGIRWNNEWVNVSVTCVGEYVGLEEVDNDIWDVYFGPVKLGRLHEKHMRIEDEKGKLKRKGV